MNGSYSSKYMELRAVLDALEANALKYVQETKDEQERIDRANKVIESSMSVLKTIPGALPEESSGGGAPCSPWFDCYGVCQPWPC